MACWGKRGPPDQTDFLGFLVDPELSRLVNQLYGVNTPPAPRTDLITLMTFFPDPAGTSLAGTGAGLTTQTLQPADILRLNLATPPTAVNAGTLLINGHQAAASGAVAVGAIGRLGGTYSEAVELIRRADRGQVLSAAVVVDAVPSELNIRQLADYARTDPKLTMANTEVARAGVVRPDLDVSDFNLPSTDADAPPPVVAAPVRPPLNREHGRIFGSKRPEASPPVDPGVVPAGGQ